MSPVGPRRLLLPGLLWTVWVAAPAQAVEVRAVRLWESPESTRIVLDLSGSAQHSLLVLKNPDRIVLDVMGAQLASGSRPPAGAGVVRQVRMARRPRPATGGQAARGVFGPRGSWR